MSSPMIALEPLFNRLLRSLTIKSDHVEPIQLPPVQVYDIEATQEKRQRTLKHLIRANHVNYSYVYNNLIYHNHMPHLLGSAFILGADFEQLHNLYENESKNLEPWKPSPSEITKNEWRDYLGDMRYQRAYTDFYEDELALRFDYNWKSLVEEYMFGGEEPLINGIIGGLTHSVIHLAYAYELSSRELAIEALVAASGDYSPFHKYVDDISYTRASNNPTNSPLEILHKIHNDTRLDGLFTSPGYENIEILFNKQEDLVLEYWNSWIIDDPVEQFQDSQEVALALVIRTVKPGPQKFDFFLVHVLTASHAIRVLLPLIPQRFRLSLIKQWWLITIALYISQLRPEIRDEIIEVPTGKDWRYVKEKALRGTFSTDAHYVKALRVIMEAGSLWRDDNEKYLAAAIRFADDFESWTGWK